MPWKIIAVAAAVCLGSVALAFHYKAESARSDQALRAAVQEKSEAVAVLEKTVSAVRVFNEVAKSRDDVVRRNNDKGEKRIAYITKSVSGDACANAIVPDDAVKRLREHRNEAYPDTGRTTK